MAAKRARDGDDGELEHSHHEKKMKRLPSFGTVIKDAIATNSIQKILAMIEPMLRRVVKEEIHRSLENFARSHSFNSRSSLKKIAPPNPSSVFRLEFPKRLSLPIFTFTKIKAEDSDPIRICIVDTSGQDTNLSQLPPSLKLEIVVIDGDFPAEEDGDWTAEAFEKDIVTERVGKRPLLHGDLTVTMKDGTATVEDLMITDNSSWVRGRHFRIGARVVGGKIGGMRIREAVSERFTVKDHRGELYKKNHPPSLTDEVWRLEKIGKNGKFHQRLSKHGIETVQEFLKLLMVDHRELRKILGQGMSDRAWEETTTHARNCVLGNKYYCLRQPRATLVLDSICRPVSVVIDGIEYSLNTLTGEVKAYVDSMVLEAYNQWKALEEIDEVTGNNPLLQNGEMTLQVPSSANHNLPVTSYLYPIAGFDFVADITNSVQVDVGGWFGSSVNPMPETDERLNPNRVSDFSSSDDDDSNISFYPGN